MSDRLETLRFLEDAAAKMVRLARRDGTPPDAAEEMGRIAIELVAQADQLKTELRLEAMAAKVANSNRRGLVGLSD